MESLLILGSVLKEDKLRKKIIKDNGEDYLKKLDKEYKEYKKSKNFLMRQDFYNWYKKNKTK